MIKLLFFWFKVWVFSCFSFSYVALGSENIFINCGSSKNVSADNRIFVPDDPNSNFFTSPPGIVTQTTDSKVSILYKSARIFTEPSSYRFVIKNHTRFWIRLHFFPFDSGEFNLKMARFSVSAQNFTLITEFPPGNSSLVKEYSLNVTSGELVLQFTPKRDSFAFVNALEIISLPENLLPGEAQIIGGERRNLQRQALETVARVNMGNSTVSRNEDKLWRLWVSDFEHNSLGKVVTDVDAVRFSGNVTDDFAPVYVYGTATMLNSDQDPNTVANVTWHFDVDPGFEYLVRLHFCDITNLSQQQFIFNVYIGSLFAFQVDLYRDTNNTKGAPYFKDVITRVSENEKGLAKPSLNVSVGPSGIDYPNAILNGLEIMKISNKIGTLDDLPTNSSSNTSSNLKIGLITGLSAILLLGFVLCLVFFLCRRKRTRLSVHLGADETARNNLSLSKIGYKFPFVLIQEATNNFDENLVIGVGGFGKVYKGVLRDNTKVAIKRGVSKTQQGLAEFKTEIGMLSQFRHRHLVSLIGYCDENNEMIILYEYMENGTLRDHLAKLSWRQRLDICIGSARGIHYLHTGSTRAVIHRDVKSANILLDESFMAKVADFGLSKTGPDVDQTHVSTAVKGSFGYLDPEYLTRQKLTEKSDVYSFGVVMLEIISGRPVIDPSLPQEGPNLVELALKLRKTGKMEEIIHPFLAGQVKPEILRKYGEIAEKCLSGSGVDRPTMGDVLWNLESLVQTEEKAVGSDGRGRDTMEENSTVSMSGVSVGNLGDIAGVSMSKVFAQMVREDFREKI